MYSHESYSLSHHVIGIWQQHFSWEIFQAQDHKHYGQWEKISSYVVCLCLCVFDVRKRLALMMRVMPVCIWWTCMIDATKCVGVHSCACACRARAGSGPFSSLTLCLIFWGQSLHWAGCLSFQFGSLTSGLLEST